MYEWQPILINPTIAPGILVYLGGGLGNQIFMCATGWEISQRLNLPLYIDTSFYRVNKNRVPEIINTKIPIKRFPGNTPWLTLKFRGRAVPVPSSIKSLFRFPVFETNILSTSKRLAKISSSRTLFGYFQSFEYFPSILENLPKVLNESNISDYGKSVIDQLSNLDFIAVHLRRGDLINSLNGETISWKFVRDQLDFLKLNSYSKSVLIFTDSPDYVSKEIEGNLPSDYSVSIFDSAGLSSLENMICMSMAKTFITGPSTFSFWAVWLASKRFGFNPTVLSPKEAALFWSSKKSGLEIFLK